MSTKTGMIPLFFSVVFMPLAQQGVLPAQKEQLLGQQLLEKDMIKLKNGSVFEGLVINETSKSVTMRIGPGQVLKMAKSQIATYIRHSDKDAVSAADLGKFRLKSRNQWFRIREGNGKVIGSLHLIARPDQGELFRLEEQWRFHGKGSLTVISRIEQIDLEMKPKYSYYREVVTSNNGRKLLNERILEVRVKGGKLEITEITPKGRKTTSIFFQSGHQFPLAARERLRQGEASGAKSYQVSIFDAMEGSFEFRVYELSEDVPFAKERFPSTSVAKGMARLIENSAFGRMQREWVSREGQVLLMEVNGLELVAEPISVELGLKLQEGGTLATMQVSPSYRTIGGFELWLPSASWRFTRIKHGGAWLHLDSGIPGTEISVRFRRRIGKKDEPLLNVAMAFLKEWKLDHPWFEETDMELTEIRGRQWVDITGVGKDKKGKWQHGRLFVCKTDADEGHLLLAANAQRKSWKRLAECVSP